MKKLNKTQIMAQWAIDNGYTKIATIVKSHYASSYYNINDAADVLSHGNIRPANCGYQGYKVGTISSDVDWTETIARTDIRDRMETEAELVEEALTRR